MRRPAWVDWALNVTAAEHAGDVERFADAADAMRDAQRGAVTGRGGVDLRTAMTGLRDRTGELARRANAVLTEPRTTGGAARDHRTAGGDRHVRRDPPTNSAPGCCSATPATTEASRSATPADTADTRRAASQKPAKEPRRRSRHRRPREGRARDPGPDLTLERRRIERDLKTADRVSHAATRDAERADTAVRHAKTAVDAATDAVDEGAVGTRPRPAPAATRGGTTRRRP